MNKALNNALPLMCMGNLRMKLDAVKILFFIRHSGNRCRVSRRHQLKTFWHFNHPVTVRHPYIQQAITFFAGMILNVFQQLAMTTGTHLGVTVFVMIGILNLAIQLGRHSLHPVTDPQHWHAQIKYQLWCRRRFVTSNRFRPSRKDNSAGFEFLNHLNIHIPTIKLTIHTCLTYPASYQLRILGTEIQNQNSVAMEVVLSIRTHIGLKFIIG